MWAQASVGILSRYRRLRGFDYGHASSLDSTVLGGSRRIIHLLDNENSLKLDMLTNIANLPDRVCNEILTKRKQAGTIRSLTTS
jgi:hypothetical protein